MLHLARLEMIDLIKKYWIKLRKIRWKKILMKNICGWQLNWRKKGAGAVNPNPMVGAVVVKNGKVIGEGYHKFFWWLSCGSLCIGRCRKGSRRSCNLCDFRAMFPLWEDTALCKKSNRYGNKKNVLSVQVIQIRK